MPWTLGLGRNQVFGGGQVLIEARHPNAPAPGLEMYVADLSPLWPTYGEFSIPKETRVSQPGRIVSRLLEGQPDDYPPNYQTFFHGHIAEILVFGRTLTPDERFRMLAYLTGKLDL